MAEQKSNEERLKELREFDLSKRSDCPGEVVHVQKNVIKFRYRNKSVDLRTASPIVLETVAKDEYCKVLQWKDKSASSSTSSSPSSSAKDTSSSKK